MNVSHYVLVCDECHGKYVGTCPHARMLQPAWREGPKSAILEKVLPENDRAAEMEGRIIDGENGAFRTEDINWLTNPRNFCRDTLPNVPFIFCAVDPNAGGSGSSFSIVTHIISGNVSYLIGIEDEPLKDPGNEGIPLLWKHFECIGERFPELSGATIVLGIETQKYPCLIVSPF